MKDTSFKLRQHQASIKERKDFGRNEKPIEDMVRTYGYSPGLMALQIRAFTPANPNGRGVPRNMIAHTTLDVEQAKELMLALQTFIEEGA